MKIVTTFVLAVFLWGCTKHEPMQTANFVAEKAERTASFTVNGSIDEVFPLFGAFEERKWEPKWNPILVYPQEEIIEEGTTFYTEGHHGEPDYLWRVVWYDEGQHIIRYLVSTPDRDWTITVACLAVNESQQTQATVTYSYIGLTPKGNKMNSAHLEKMYQHNLQDWADALNNYLVGS